MKDHEKIIQEILIESFSKINNVNYYFVYENFSIKVNTKRLFISLVNKCDHFEGGSGTNCHIEYLRNIYFWMSYRHIWSRLEEKTKLDYGQLQNLLEKVLIERFELNKMPMLRTRYLGKVSKLRSNFDQLHGITFKNIGITAHGYRSTSYMKDGFELKGVR
jgi:hypothetical protein